MAGINAIVTTPDPLPAGGSFPIEFVLRSTDEHKEMVEYANQLVLYANTEANAGGGAPTFYFADSDLKYDLPQVEIEIDKDKVASMGLSLSEVARDLGSMLGGGYVNRFVNDGRSYRVIPQVERGERLNPDQLLDYHIRGPQGQLISLSTIATLKHTVQPRTLNRFQQLNSIKITGVGPGVDAALKKLEAKAAEVLPPGYSIDYGGQSRQLRNEGDRLLPALGLALVLIFFGLGRTIQRLPRSIYYTTRFGAIGLFWRHVADLPLEDFIEYLFPDRAYHFGGFDRQKWHINCGICQHPPGKGRCQNRCHSTGGYYPTSSGIDDISSNGVWSHDAHFCHWSRCSCPKQYLLGFGRGHGHWFGLHPVCGASFLCALGADHSISPATETESVAVPQDPVFAK